MRVACSPWPSASARTALTPSWINTLAGHRPKAGRVGCLTVWTGPISFCLFAQRRITAASVGTKNQVKARGRTGKAISSPWRCTTRKVKRRSLCQCYDGQNERFIPEPLRGHTRHLLNSETNYTKLYAFLTGQAGVTPGELGSLKTLAPACADDLGKGLNELIAEPERCR